MAEQVRLANEHVDNWYNGRNHLDLVREMCRNLCNIREEEIPRSIAGCKKMLRRIYINIYDYVEGRYDLQKGTRRELFQRCKQLKRECGYGFFPIHNARAEGLKDLLKHLS